MATCGSSSSMGFLVYLRWFTVACLGLSLLVACQEQTYPDLATGKALYEHHCLGCHKSHGNGMFIKGVPASRLKRIHLEDLKRQLKEGAGMMPSFDKLTEEQINKINRYLKSQIGKYNG